MPLYVHGGETYHAADGARVGHALVLPLLLVFCQDPARRALMLLIVVRVEGACRRKMVSTKRAGML